MKQKNTKLKITLSTLQFKIIAALNYYMKTKENKKQKSRQNQNKIFLKTKFRLNNRIMYIQYDNYILTNEKQLLSFNSLILSNTEESCLISHK